MKIKATSFFKSPDQDKQTFENWVNRLEQANNRKYERYSVQTKLGNTHVWGINTRDDFRETLVIFPGARTSALFWDFDRNLDHLGKDLRIFLIETNGLPNLSDGATPDIKSEDYGFWADEVMTQLAAGESYIAGASFGGLICMKLAMVSPQRIKSIFLLNPGCLQPFSLKWKNLYYNLLPIISPTDKNVLKFLDKAVFSKPHHQLSPVAEKLIVDYEVFALKRYKDRTQKPYYMGEELSSVKVDTFLLEGDKDLLFPFQKSVENARTYIKSLRDIHIFENVGHGIETFGPALKYIRQKIYST
ncbi:MAG: alpha/beta hydrolase [Bacteroidia bacterium]